jgi:hypothetical protein
VPINGIMVLENIGLNEGILLKQTCKKCGMSVFCAFCGSRYGPVTSPCEHGNQRQGCTIVAQLPERIISTIRYMRISSNITMYQVVWWLLYVKHNYMFRPQMLAILRLYNENLSISYNASAGGV